MTLHGNLNDIELDKQYCEFEAEKDEFHNNATDSRDKPWHRNKSSIKIMREEEVPWKEPKIRPLKSYCRRPYIYPEEHDEIYRWGSEALRTGLIPRPPNGQSNFPYFLKQYLKFLKDKKS